MRHADSLFFRASWLALFFGFFGFAALGPSPLQAQSESEDGPSSDQLMEVLPSTLPAMKRTDSRKDGPSTVVGVYERTGQRGPPRVEVKVMYGQTGLKKAQTFVQRPETDSTTIPDGRTFYSGVIEQESPVGMVLWNDDPYVVTMTITGTSEASLSTDQAKTFLEPLRDEMADAVSADDLPTTESSSESSM